MALHPEESREAAQSHQWPRGELDVTRKAKGGATLPGPFERFTKEFPEVFSGYDAWVRPLMRAARWMRRPANW